MYPSASNRNTPLGEEPTRMNLLWPILAMMFIINFYNIWHDLFGATNRMLVEAGLFADPYSEFYGAKGIIPVVFDESLYEGP